MSWSWSFSIPVFTAILLLASLVITLDIIKKTTGHRYLRILFILLAGLALYGMQVPLRLPFDPAKQEVIIHTGGDELPDSLISKQTVVFEDLISWLRNAKSKPANSLTVFGHGLEPWELAMVQQPFRFIPENLPEGLLSISVPNLFQGLEAELSGDYLIDSTTQLHLSLPGGSTKTLELLPDASRFTSTVSLSTTGRQLIGITGIRGTDTIFHEKIPVRVQPRPIIEVLLLSGFPTFEQKALVQWMETMHYKVVTIQQLTRDQYRTNFYNQSVNRKLKTDSPFIRQLDLIILDQAGLEALSPGTLETVKSQIKKGELGLIWLDEPSQLAAEFELNLENASRTEINLASPAGQVTLSTWKQNLSADPQKNSQTSMFSTVRNGFGKISHPRFYDSYLLKLQGQDSLYGTIWKELVSSTMGVKPIDKKILIDPYATVGYKSIVELEAPVDANFKIGNQSLYPRQNELKPDWVMLDFFPETIDWQSVRLNDSIVDHMYVAPAAQWYARKTLIKHQLTHLAAWRSQKLTPESISYTQPISNWWWYGLLLFSLSILWIEHRIRS